MGAVGPAAYGDDGEGPIHVVELSPYRLAAHTVTNDEYAAFVDATGHVTDAERFGWSFGFAGHLPDDFPPTHGVAQRRGGVRSRVPIGGIPRVRSPGSTVWAATRWSTSRGATPSPPARGTAPACQPRPSRSTPHAAAWPVTRSRGGTTWSPTDAFEPNGFGAHNMTGNVWEWCADCYSPTSYRHSAKRDPAGPVDGTHRVMRGGSYLCDESYCRRRVDSARADRLLPRPGVPGTTVKVLLTTARRRARVSSAPGS